MCSGFGSGFYGLAETGCTMEMFGIWETDRDIAPGGKNWSRFIEDRRVLRNLSHDGTDGVLMFRYTWFRGC